jgi:hypothetical protein
LCRARSSSGSCPTGPASAGSQHPGFFGRYTKVNRLLTEGRRAFLRRVSGIQRGTECASYEPLLSALADGEASAEDLARLRPHMQTCLSCRAALREFRALPERVASVVPPASLLAAESGGPLRSLVESIVGTAQHKAAVLGERAHAAAELATGQKVAAVAASAAALAGGGTAVDQFSNHQGPPQPAAAEQVEAKPVKEEVPVEPAPQEPLYTEQAVVAEPAPAPAPEPEPPAPPPPSPDPAYEFAPGGNAPAGPASPTPGAAPAQPAGGGFMSGGRGEAGGGGGRGEFAP